MKYYTFDRDELTHGDRLKTCTGCPSASFDVMCNVTWHRCTKGHYSDVRALPIAGECPDFPKPEDNVPGEVLENARKLTEKKTIPEVVKVLGIDV